MKKKVKRKEMIEIYYVNDFRGVIWFDSIAHKKQME